MDTSVAAPPTGFVARRVVFDTAHAPQFIDLTDHVNHVVREAGFCNGLLSVTSRHTTAAIIVNEHEPELLKDLSRMLREIAPPERNYAHNQAPCEPTELPNGHAHCQALLLSSSVSIPLMDGKAVLGCYQRIFLVELDRPRRREVTVTVLGM